MRKEKATVKQSNVSNVGNVSNDEVKEKHAGGRPTKFKEEYNQYVEKLCMLGATDEDIAAFFNVTFQTVNNWKNTNPEFFEALTRGKKIANANVAHSLYQRAIGYAHKETITANFQGQITDSIEVDKCYPPDTMAASLWLRCREPDKFREKQEVELSGEIRSPVLNINITGAVKPEDK